jgi:peptidoglycan hydrolase-like protein with peptidoglycan-binding domain
MVAAVSVAILALPAAASATAHSASAPTHTAGSSAIVRVGDGYSRSTGSRSVRWVQRRLHALGYATGPLDGRFGPLTERAVSRFQATHHLQVDGDVGPITSKRLRSARALVRFGAGYAQPHGSRGVRAIQRRLRALGYTPGPLDGRFGPITRRAVLRFQVDHRLTDDGEVGPRTYARLRPRSVAPPSTPTRVDQREPARPQTRPDPRAPRPQRAARRLTPPAPLPHSPPAEAIVIGFLVIGLAVFTGSYLYTRSRLAEGRRGSYAASTANGRERAR